MLERPHAPPRSRKKGFCSVETKCGDRQSGSEGRCRPSKMSKRLSAKHGHISAKSMPFKSPDRPEMIHSCPSGAQSAPNSIQHALLTFLYAAFARLRSDDGTVLAERDGRILLSPCKFVHAPQGLRSTPYLVCMFPFARVAVSLFGLLVLLFHAGPAAAQPSADSLRAAALRDYNGPDGTGKDGPLAKAGRDLLLLYHEYRAVQQQDPDTTFSPRLVDVRVEDGRVRIEAVATNTADELLVDLKALGLKDGVTAGRLVSGRLPIGQIPAMARLESLRGLIPSGRQTREQTPPSTSGAPPSVPTKRTPSPPELPAVPNRASPDSDL